jgi:hypothetical protein
MERWSEGAVERWSEGAVERSEAGRKQVDQPWKGLADLRVATRVGRPFCIDIGSAVGRAHGISAAQIASRNIASRNLASRNDDRTDFNFSGRERLVPEYADPIAETPVEVPNARFARLRENFREGAVCALPVWAAAADRSA